MVASATYSKQIIITNIRKNINEHTSIFGYWLSIVDLRLTMIKTTIYKLYDIIILFSFSMDI